LYKKTVAEPDDSTVAIHSCYRCLGVDGIYERTADNVKETAECVLGYVVAVGRENSAVSDDGEDYEYDKGKEAHASFEGGVVTGELEEDRDYIDGDEDCSFAYSGYSEENKYIPNLKNLTGKTRRLVVVKMVLLVSPARWSL
jgi:hypothetical protein